MQNSLQYFETTRKCYVLMDIFTADHNSAELPNPVLFPDKRQTVSPATARMPVHVALPVMRHLNKRLRPYLRP